jgi:hypothetical protein
LRPRSILAALFHPVDPGAQNPLCAIELKAGESKDDIDLASQWAATYDLPLMQCRGDIPRQAYAWARAHPGIDPIQWFVDHGIEIPAQAMTWTMTSTRPPGANYVSISDVYGIHEGAFDPRCTMSCVVTYDSQLVRPLYVSWGTR